MDTDAQRTDCIVVGAGQAGLAMSHCLRRAGVEHVVLERARVAERWRTQSWDSLTLLTPNWQARLPGHRYPGIDPDGFMTGADVVAMLEHYGSDAPVRAGVDVTGVQHHDRGWLVRSPAGNTWAPDVVIATGDHGQPYVPALSALLDPALVQLHTSEYRAPHNLPAGATLVVGAGPSGQQIALKLARAGRRVHLAVGQHQTLPRRYRGHDTYSWMDRLGILDRRVDDPPAQCRRTLNGVLAVGDDDLDVHRLVEEGVTPHGRLLRCTDDVLEFADDLSATIHANEAGIDRFRGWVDGYISQTGISAPRERVRRRSAPWAQQAATSLSVSDAGVTSVVWATGFQPDFSWIHAPVLDAAGEPIQDRGVSPADGLYFLGLSCMHRASSGFLGGVGHDAKHLVERICARHGDCTRSAA